MKHVFLALIFISGAAFAQISRKLGDFNQVKVYDRISVELIQSAENKIEINGDRSNEVEIVNKNGELKIRMSLKKLLDGEDIDVKLYYTELRNIDANEGSYVGSSSRVSGAIVGLSAQEGAQIKLDVETERLTSRAVTGGIIKLTGKTSELDVKIATGGIVQARDLQSEEAKVEVKAGGEADVNASELVDADIKAGGTITIYGDPKKVNEKTSLGGTIRSADQ